MTEELITLLGGREIGRVHREAKARLSFTATGARLARPNEPMEEGKADAGDLVILSQQSRTAQRNPLLN